MSITIRNQLRLWWSTTPALVGYPDYPGQQIEAKSDLLKTVPFRGTARAVLAEMARVRRDVGDGVFVAFFVRTADGREVDVGELKEIVQDADFRAMRH